MIIRNVWISNNIEGFLERITGFSDTALCCWLACWSVAAVRDRRLSTSWCRERLPWMSDYHEVVLLRAGCLPAAKNPRQRHHLPSPHACTTYSQLFSSFHYVLLASNNDSKKKLRCCSDSWAAAASRYYGSTLWWLVAVLAFNDVVLFYCLSCLSEPKDNGFPPRCCGRYFTKRSGVTYVWLLVNNRSVFV